MVVISGCDVDVYILVEIVVQRTTTASHGNSFGDCAWQAQAQCQQPKMALIKDNGSAIIVVVLEVVVIATKGQRQHAHARISLRCHSNGLDGGLHWHFFAGCSNKKLLRVVVGDVVAFVRIRVLLLPRVVVIVGIRSCRCSSGRSTRSSS